jgi:hypothetical protein
MAKPQKKTTKQQDTITEFELRSFETLREEASAARKRVKQLEELVKGQAAQIIARLDAGAVTEGAYEALIEEGFGQCRPEWKEEYLQHFEIEHGIEREATEAAIRHRYPAPPTRTLVVGPATKK